ncbi:hypothetical protein F4054_06480 [Candidatus Poribacteria bacterium]|nr:hypothetical protein [Candidatus Poribacteria bacterium]MYG05100.1 hypothetical protein [Candidatus Poribacteria bacterium]MYK21887.1 hypothetical protein [Candidatus Poribacteria bacterium]
METSISTDTRQSINLWHKCTVCKEAVFRGELERNLYICPHCGALFPLLAEKRLEYLLDDPSVAKSRSTRAAGLTAEGTISEYPACLFIADIDVIPVEIDVSLLLASIENALQKQMPLITIIACQPEGYKDTLKETLYVTMQMERLAEASLPHITVITETEVYPLATHLPIGELVIAEGTVAIKKPTPPNLQPALHAPEEQLITQAPTLKTDIEPDISVDCYIPREELPNILGLFLKFFSP